MSEPIKNPRRTPESYNPKKPEIASIMKDAADNIYPESFTLEKVEQDGQHHPGSRSPEMQPFTTSIRAFFDYTGQNYGFIDHDGWRLDRGFTLICNLSGEAYVDDRHMCGGNDISVGQERYANMFSQLGYKDYELVYTKDVKKEAVKNRIIKILAHEKTPVIVGGFVECPLGCVVVGYEKNGDVLIGWNYHVFDFSPNPQPQIFKSENWYEDAAYVAFIGKRTDIPELKNLYYQGIVTAFNTLTDDGVSMKNAKYFDDWKRYFTQSEDECIEEAKRTHYIIGYGTPADSLFADDEAIRQELLRTVDPAWCEYSERRYYAKWFMRQAQGYFPEQKQILEEIACCFERISHVHMEAFIDKVGREPIDRDKLRNSSIRAEMAEIIGQCRGEEEKVIFLLKQIIEGYNPKKPEIANMMKEATDSVKDESKAANVEIIPEPRIIQKTFTLVGVKNKITDWSNFGPLLNELYQAVNTRLTMIKGLAKPVRMVGFWHMDSLPSGEREYCYFAGVEADTDTAPDGLTVKTLPESLYAVFTEQKRGTMGSPEGYGYKWVRASEYEGNEDIPGDFEIYSNTTDTGPECEAEILIPIKPKQSPEGYNPKKPEIANAMKEKQAILVEENGMFIHTNNVELIILNDEIKVVGLSFNKCKQTGSLTLNSPFDLYGRESFETQDHIKNIKLPQIGYAVGVIENENRDLIVGKAVTDINGQDEIYGSYVIPAGRYLKVSFNAKDFEELVQEKLPKSGELFNVDAFLKSNGLKKDHVLYIEVYPHETCCVGQKNGPGWGPKYMKASMTTPTTQYPEMYTLHTVKEIE